MTDDATTSRLDRPFTVRDAVTLCIALRKRATRQYALHGLLADALTDIIEILSGESDKPEWR